MKTGKSEVIIVLDRSGSMESIKNDMEGGLKTFIEKQKLDPGECFVSLYQFDTEYETVFENKNIQDVESIKIFPRGSTALFDAIGKATNSVGERLSKTSDEDRPETVIFVAITDGQENSSKEFKSPQIKDMVSHQTDKYNWKYLFMGANQDAILNGQNIGVVHGSSLNYGTSSQAISGAFFALSSGISCMKSVYTTGTYSFSEYERKLAMGEQ